MTRQRLTDRVAAARTARAAGDTIRTRRVIERREGMRVTVAGRELLNFSSNDYLGLSQHLDVIAAMQEGSAWHGVGGSASAQVSGHHAEHSALENECAEWMGYARGLPVGSGSLAKPAVMQSLH